MTPHPLCLPLRLMTSGGSEGLTAVRTSRTILPGGRGVRSEPTPDRSLIDSPSFAMTIRGNPHLSFTGSDSKGDPHHPPLRLRLLRLSRADARGSGCLTRVWSEAQCINHPEPLGVAPWPACPLACLSWPVRPGRPGQAGRSGQGGLGRRDELREAKSKDQAQATDSCVQANRLVYE